MRLALLPGMLSLEKTPASAGPETGSARPPSVLLRYASLLVLVVMALAAVIARESWVAYRASAGGSAAPLASVLVTLALAAGALPLALTAWLAVLARLRLQLREPDRSAAALRDSEALAS